MAHGKPVGVFAQRLTGKCFGKRGFSGSALIEEWEQIVGAHDSMVAQPVKIVFPRGERSNGVLYLKVATGSAALMLQHREQLMIERINAHFGYGAVDRIVMAQGPIQKKRKPKKNDEPPVLTPKAEQWLSEKLASVENQELKEVLERLGRRLAAKKD